MNEWMNVYPAMCELTKKVYYVIKFFVAADKLNAFIPLNENTINAKRLMVLSCALNFEQN